ncbi:MAG: class I SAM-dependent methyltransferase [bacterium]|nr:class I SAM-dependent methyltransferase [bacterium]
MFKRFIHKNDIFQLYKPYLPEDASGTVTAEYYPRRLLPNAHSARINLLDLGCGAGNSVTLFKSINPHICWFGVDIENSPEGKNRTGAHDKLSTYDGINLPYENNFFDFIYTQQVFEHVRYPDALLKDIYRVLRPGGYFTGSMSYLEPYHSYSIYNFTPYGLIVSLRDAGFSLHEIRPGIDGPAMLMRQILNAPGWLNPLIRRYSPFKVLIDFLGFACVLGHQERNFLKVQFAGHLVFSAQKNELHRE